MKPRAELRNASPKVRKVYEAMIGVEGAINAGGLERSLLDLVRMRASQINGCAYCLDMHSKDLRAQGETEQRLYSLDAWTETPFFSDRERAALTWAEAVTNLSAGHVSDEVYEKVRDQFTEEELELLTAAIAGINFWNRLNVSFRTVPGDYRAPANLSKRRDTVAVVD
ncbi:MAG: carboxymuconolactone decarboxylase family protein [Gemmataceae bacterium]